MRYVLLFLISLNLTMDLEAQEYLQVIEDARECFQKKDFMCAEEKLIEAIKQVPKDYSKTYLLYNNLANSQLNQGKKKDALKSVNKAIKQKKSKAELYGNRAEIKIDLTKYKSAIKDCKIAIELDPNLSNAYVTRGHAKIEIMDFDSAIDDFFRALELDSENINSLFNIAYVFIKKDSLDKALEIHDKLVKIYYDKAPADKLAILYNNRADVFLKMKELEKAKLDIDKALELDSACTVCYLTYGEYGLELQDYTLACEQFYKAIELGFDKSLIKHYLEKCE